MALLHDPFKAVDAGAFEAVPQQWVLRVLGPPPHPTSPIDLAQRATALDGKALRGRHGAEGPGGA